MKRTFSILLFAFLLANLAGFYVYFYFRLESIHKEMKAALMNCPDTQLQKISLSLAQYQQAKNDEGEIKWNGQMYDVAHTRIQDGRVIVLALRDELETNLLVLLKSVVGTAAADNQRPPSALMQYLSLVFIVPTQVAPSYSSDLPTNKYFSFYSFHYYPTTVDVLSPPPRLTSLL